MVRYQVELMEITYFSGDKDKHEINLGERLRMIRKICKTHFGANTNFYGEVREWWMNIDKDSRRNSTWEVIEKMFIKKWMKDSKIEAIHTIEYEFNETKECFFQITEG
jgi:hypothetical protein